MGGPAEAQRQEGWNMHREIRTWAALIWGVCVSVWGKTIVKREKACFQRLCYLVGGKELIRRGNSHVIKARREEYRGDGLSGFLLPRG